MYDISFIMICSTNCTAKADYKKRITLFKEHGLLNIKDKKIKLFLLISSNDIIRDIEEGWNYDVEIVKSSYDHVAHKFHKFYADLTKDFVSQSRWFMQLDDDSMTNVSDLVDRLDKDYNYKDKYNITGTKEPIDNNIILEHYFRIMAKTSYKDIFNKENAYKYVHHGWEHTIFSQGALYHFISESNNKIILEDSLSIKGVSISKYTGDVLPTVLSNICNIPFCVVDYLYHDIDFEKFIKKELFHHHYIYKFGINQILSKITKLTIEK